jgi:hypothetical protein
MDVAKTPIKDGTPWTKQDLATLKKMAPTRPIGIIANELGRSTTSVRSKAQREGILVITGRAVIVTKRQSSCDGQGPFLMTELVSRRRAAIAD